MDKKKSPQALLALPLAIGAAFALLYAFAPWRNLEMGIYDTFLRLKPEVREDASLVLLDINDTSIDRIGTYPWPRGLLAQGLEAITELGAEYAIFDIEYLEKSPMSVDTTYLNGGLKSEFDTTFEEIGSNMNDVLLSLSDRRIPLSDADDYGQALIDYIDQSNADLYGKTGRVAIENDVYLGQAMRLFGNAFTTLNMQQSPPQEQFADRYAVARERYTYPRITVDTRIKTGNQSYFVPIPEISTMSRNAGFTNVEIDEDGVRRRIRLVDTMDGQAYLQLAFSPLMRRLGEPEIVVRDRELLLRGAKYPDGTRDVRIPLDSRGFMLIRWPKTEFADSFTHVPFFKLIDYSAAGEATANYLRQLKTSQGWILGPGYAPIDACLSAWTESEATRAAALESGDPADKDAWLASRKAYWDAVGAFVAMDYGESVGALFDQARDADDPALAPQYDAMRDDFRKFWRNMATSYENRVALGEYLGPLLSKAFCVIGWTASATTDIGVNPFWKEYVNVGTHAAVANTILQRDFLTEAPYWLSSMLALAMSAGVLVLLRRLKTLQQILTGLGATVALIVADYLVFHFTGVYVALLSPVLATFVSFVTYSLMSFLLSEQEKSFLRKAFGTYLSGDVINQIVADPSMLKLGGQKRWMSAMFTDIRGFSTVSEQLDAEQLVQLLNLYLSGMSNIVLENRGTIDKYEGDAIIAFFGAPLDYKEHAMATCTSAILMKRKEAELNERFMAEKIAPNPLYTRIGINTGDMVVGNMGTERKMDYTIMGNAVNLAARLEGVNKQYGSWILMSDATYKETGDAFLVRRFDKVRVVGINTPVQLWELLDFKADAKPELLDFLARFEEAHKVFDGRDWAKAQMLFMELSAERPDDGPSKAYLKKCENFIQKPPVAEWDGVFSLTEK